MLKSCFSANFENEQKVHLCQLGHICLQVFKECAKLIDLAVYLQDDTVRSYKEHLRNISELLTPPLSHHMYRP